MVHVPVKCRYDISESWSVGVRIASLSTSKNGSHCFSCCTHLQLSKELNAWQLTLSIKYQIHYSTVGNVHGMDLMIVWQLLCMIQTYSNHRTIYTLLHSTMRGWMRPAEHVVIAGSQQAELANDYSLLFKDEHLNPARILPLVLCIITNKKHARLPEFTVLQNYLPFLRIPPGSYHFSHRIGLFVLGSQDFGSKALKRSDHFSEFGRLRGSCCITALEGQVIEKKGD